MERKEVDISSIIANVELSAEIARIALECPNCYKAVRELIQSSEKTPVRGHSSLQVTNEKDRSRHWRRSSIILERIVRSNSGGYYV
jgi:hypothetical protein